MEVVGSGIYEIEGVMEDKCLFCWVRVLVVKFFGGFLVFGFGFVLGCEGLIIYMGVMMVEVLLCL